jgi:hypothetical protein
VVRFKYLDDPVYKQDAHEALTDRFASRNNFDTFCGGIASNSDKNTFLRVASHYLFLCKKGDWVVDVPARSNPVIGYFTNSFKLTVLCALIESLYEETPRWKDCIEYLISPKGKESFPILDAKHLKKVYDLYNKQFGSTQRLRRFLHSLPDQTRNRLLKKFKIEGKVVTENQLASILYHARSSFVHVVEFVHILSGSIFDQVGKHLVFSEAQIHDLMNAFEIGLVAHFSTKNGK